MIWKPQAKSPSHKKSMLNIDTNLSKEFDGKSEVNNLDSVSNASTPLVTSIILKSEINQDSTIMNTDGDETKVQISMLKSPLHETLNKINPIFELDYEHKDDENNTNWVLELSIPDPKEED